MRLSRRFYGFLMIDVLAEMAEGKATPCQYGRNAQKGPWRSLGCRLCCLVILRQYAYVGHGGLIESDILEATTEDATVRKPDMASDRSNVNVEVTADSILGGYPLISEYLVSSQYDDGSPRELSTIKFGLYQGQWRLSLDDHDLKQSVYSVGDGIMECLDLMEGALRNDGVRWYRWGAHKGKSKK